jgi:hypothetical protein
MSTTRAQTNLDIGRENSNIFANILREFIARPPSVHVCDGRLQTQTLHTHTERERERERESVSVYVCMCARVCLSEEEPFYDDCERERRAPGVEQQHLTCTHAHTHTHTQAEVSQTYAKIIKSRNTHTHTHSHQHTHTHTRTHTYLSSVVFARVENSKRAEVAGFDIRD